MQKEYNNCKNYETINCPEKNNEMMKDLISKTDFIPDIQNDLTEGLTIGIKVDEILCSKCKYFKKLRFNE